MTSALFNGALAPLRTNPASTAILLDIDGTLSPIVENAADAGVPEPTRQLLIALARRYGTLACVSGRRASEARAMVGVGAITYIGSHGAELLAAGWTEAAVDPNVERWNERIDQFRREADTPQLRRARVRIEDKGSIVAFHWRGAADEVLAKAAVDALAENAQLGGLHVHWGRKVMEVRPPVQIDKGAGVAALLQRGSATQALYAGDDVTDLDAFRMLTKLQAEGSLRYAVRVGVSSDDGPPEIVSEADVVVNGTTGVQELLAALIADGG